MSAQNEHPHVHVMPLKIYFGVFGALIVLTLLTVGVSYAGLGVFAIYAAMLVALIKGGLVVGYFMHLKFDTKFHQLVFFGSLFFMSVFFVFIFLDLSSRARVNPEQGNFALARDRASKALTDHQEKLEAARDESKKLLAAKVTPADVDAARAIYVARCQTCHGPKGRGNGPAGVALNPKPRDYTDLKWQKRVSNQQIARVILRGGIGTGLAPTMPPHPDLRPKIAAMVAFLRSFAGIDLTTKPEPPKAALAPAPVPKAAPVPVPAPKVAPAPKAAAAPAAKPVAPAAKP